MTCRRAAAASTAGYKRHMRADEPICDICQTAARAYWRAHSTSTRYVTVRVDGHNRGGAPLLILDIIEANQPITTQELAAFVDKSLSTIRRAMYRLIDASEIVKTGASLTLPEQGDLT